MPLRRKSTSGLVTTGTCRRGVLLEAEVVVTVLLDDRARGEPHQADREEGTVELAEHVTEIR
jgi:hypothetical protein